MQLGNKSWWVKLLFARLSDSHQTQAFVLRLRMVLAAVVERITHMFVTTVAGLLFGGKGGRCEMVYLAS